MPQEPLRVGDLILLENQDRSRRKRDQIAEGFVWLLFASHAPLLLGCS
jgi:hypothetical protein